MWIRATRRSVPCHCAAPPACGAPGPTEYSPRSFRLTYRTASRCASSRSAVLLLIPDWELISLSASGMAEF